MKMHLTFVFAALLLPVACSDAQQTRTATAALSSEEQAANQLYLDDVQDSAGDDTSSTTTSDGSVEDDVKTERLEHMAQKLLTELDTDASGSLSLAEFLVGPEKRADDKGVDDERKARMIAKLTEDFKTFAGDDALLSLDEIKTLLKAAAPRVGCHRQDKFPGQQAERVKQTWAEIIEKYDTNGDGLLSQAEYEAMEAARKAEHEAAAAAHDKEGEQPGGHGGHGPGGPRGP